MNTSNPRTPPEIASSGRCDPFPDADRTGRFHLTPNATAGVQRPPHPGRRCAAGEASRS